MTMHANGLAKLTEECGELITAASKKMECMGSDSYWGTDKPISQMLEEEMADVLATIRFVTINFGLNQDRIGQRMKKKLDLYLEWHQDPENEFGPAGKPSEEDVTKTCVPEYGYNFDPENDLLSCPFCGGAAYYWINSGYADKHTVECEDCGSKRSAEYSKKYAFRNWNKRPKATVKVSEFGEK